MMQQQQQQKQRRLNPYERAMVDSFVVFSFRLRPCVGAEQVRAAASALVERYPALSFAIASGDDGNGYFFVSAAADVQLAVHDERSPLAAASWKERLSEVCAVRRDVSRSLIFYDLFRDEAQDVSELVLSVNHVPCDGRSLLVLCGAFLSLLDAAVAGKTLQPRSSSQATAAVASPLVDVLSLAQPVERFELKPAPATELSCLPVGPVEDLSKAELRAVYGSIDPETTARLLARIKSAGLSVQGALLAAGLLAVSSMLDDGSSSSSSSHTFATMTPCVVRRFFDPPLTDECLCNASFPLFGTETVATGEAVLAVAKRSSKTLRDQLEGKMFWQTAHAFTHPEVAAVPGVFPKRPFSASSIGCLKLEPFAALHLDDCWLRTNLNRPFFPPERDSMGFMTHAITVNGSLHLCTSFGWPAFSEEQMQRFVDTTATNLASLAL